LWPLFVVLLPLWLVGVILWLIAGVLLLLIVWVSWWPRRRYALVVYSNSPIWQEYFQTHFLPAIGDRGVVLNWSDRSRWKYSLPVLLFKYFGGRRNFNPLAIVFEPFHWPRRFRFYPAFQSFKHGHPEEVERIRDEFFQLLADLAAPEKAD
jgi:hypothetical protein